MHFFPWERFKWNLKDKIGAYIACHNKVSLQLMIKNLDTDYLDTLYALDSMFTEKLVIKLAESEFQWNDSPEALVLALKYRSEFKKVILEYFIELRKITEWQNVVDSFIEVQRLWEPWLVLECNTEYQGMRLLIDKILKNHLK